jgi:hypothetical protein
MGIPSEKGHDAISALIKLASDWMKTKGHRLCWIVTRENGPDKGPHAHILWHIPHSLSRAFFARWPHWKAKLKASYAVPGVGRKGRVLKTKCIGGTAKTYVNNAQLFSFHLHEVLSYVLKGAHPNTIAALELTKPHQPGGMIIGRRAGWWREHKPRGEPRATRHD